MQFPQRPLQPTYRRKPQCTNISEIPVAILFAYTSPGRISASASRHPVPVAQGGVRAALRLFANLARSVPTAFDIVWPCSYPNVFKSIPGSSTSVDFIISSQVTSRLLYAAVRARMQDIADSAPLAA